MLSYWRECLDWMRRCNMLLKEKIEDPYEFARILRDGVILCNLLISIDSNCFNIKDINNKPELGKIFCLNNIRLFLLTCKTFFGMQNSDLFDPNMLYDLTDFSQVIKTLYNLSKNPKAIIKTQPFELNNEKLNSIKGFDKDLEYFAEQSHIPKQSLFQENDELYEQLCTLRRANHQVLIPSPKDKWEHCLRELIETENNYINALKDVVNNFLLRMREVLNKKELDLIYGKIEILIEIHKNFEKRLVETISHTIFMPDNVKPYRTEPSNSTNSSLTNKDHSIHTEPILQDIFDLLHKSEISSNNFSDLKSNFTPSLLANQIGECFLEFIDKFLIYGEYCSHLGQSQSYIDKLLDENVNFRNLLQECQMTASQGKFHLRDLIALPMQRILKYHILIKELMKNSPQPLKQKESLNLALESMLDLTDYINELKRDNEDLELTNGIQKSIANLHMPNNGELSIYGKLIRDGELKVKSPHDSRLKIRYVFLFDTVIMFCKPNKSDSYNFKVALSVDQCNIDLPQMPESVKMQFLESLLVSVQYYDDCSPPLTPNEAQNNGFQNRPIRYPNVANPNNRFQPKKLNFDLKQSEWWKQKYKKRSESKWSYPFVLLTRDNDTVFNVYAKTYDSWIKWLQAFTLAQDNLCPNIIKTTTSNNHPFQYVTFNKPTRCSYCKKLLKGAIYQGYRCQSLDCGYIAHKQCIHLIRDQCAKPLNGFNTQSYRKTLPPIIPIRTADEKYVDIKKEFLKVNSTFQSFIFQNGDGKSLQHHGSSQVGRGLPVDNSYGVTMPKSTGTMRKCSTSSLQSNIRSPPNNKTYLKKKSTTLSYPSFLTGTASSPLLSSANESFNFFNEPTPMTTTTLAKIVSTSSTTSIINTPFPITCNLNHKLATSSSTTTPYSNATMSSYKSPRLLKSTFYSSGTLSRHCLAPKRSQPPLVSLAGNITPLPSTTKTSNYCNLDLNKNPWYYGEMTREMAKKCLLNKTSGTFLVRNSSRHNGNPVITLNYQNEIKHIKIAQKDDKDYYISETKYFSSIVELIAHYHVNTLAQLFEGIHTPLTFPYLLTESSPNQHIPMKCNVSSNLSNIHQNVTSNPTASISTPVHLTHSIPIVFDYASKTNSSNTFKPTRCHSDLKDRFFFDGTDTLSKYLMLDPISFHQNDATPNNTTNEALKNKRHSTPLNLQTVINVDNMLLINPSTFKCTSNSSSCDTTFSSSSITSMTSDKDAFVMENEVESEDTILSLSKLTNNEHYELSGNNPYPTCPSYRNPTGTDPSLSPTINHITDGLKYMNSRYKVFMNGSNTQPLLEPSDTSPRSRNVNSNSNSSSNSSYPAESPDKISFDSTLIHCLPPLDAISNLSTLKNGVTTPPPAQYVGSGIATYIFEAYDERMISFKPGDTILITDRVNDNNYWWRGHVANQNKIGFFPKNYVKQYPL